MEYVAIDPGKSGAIVGMDDSRKVFLMEQMPMMSSKKQKYDLQSLCSIIEDHKQASFIVERTRPIYGSSLKSMHSFGFGAGCIRGMLVCTGCRYTVVRAKEWQKVVWQTSDKVRRKKKGNKNATIVPKETSLNAARRLFPGEDFLPTNRHKVPHDGVVDAMLMCEYAIRKNL